MTSNWILRVLAGLMLAAPGAALAEDTVNPDRLLLTWQRDPTSTMTVQWLTRAEFLPAVEDQAPEAQPHDIPHIGDVAIDAAGDDWWDAGLALDFLADESHQLPSDPDQFSADARLGWNEEGLVLLVRVRDDFAVEHEELNMLWNADGLELFVAEAVGSDNRYQVALAPGADEAFEGPRHNFHPKDGGPAAEELSIDYASRITDDGYVFEVLLPWANIDALAPERGQALAFQMYVNDRDGEDAYRSLNLHPARNASSNADAMYAFRLADEAGSAIQSRAEVREDSDGLIVRVYGQHELAGRTVTVRSGDEDLAAAALEADGRRASVTLTLPDAPEGRRWGRLEAVLDDETRVATLDTPAGVGAVEPDPVELVYWPSDDADDRRTATVNVSRIANWPGKFRYRVELTGLDPATAYRFKAEGDDADYGFHTMPANLDEPLRIAIGGDTRHSQDWMERTNAAAMAYEPDFILWGGDFAYADGRMDRLYRWEEWFDANANTLIDDEGYVVPIVGAIGNHEVQGGYYTSHEDFEPTDAWRLRISPYFYQLFAFPGHPGYGALDFGDYLSVLALDSAHTNPVAGEQTEWLAETLAQREDVTHVLPLYHVPGYPSHRPYHGGVSTDVRDHWMPLFEQYGVRMAFENHDHTYKRTPAIRDGEVDPSGVVYIGDGAWGVGVRSVHDPEETWYLERAESQRHAIILTLHGTHQHVVVVNEDGEEIDEYPDTGRLSE